MPNDINNCLKMEEKLASYRKRIRQFILKFVKDPAMTEDLTQEVLVKIWLRRDKIKEFKALDSYIFTVSKNLVIDHFTRLAKERSYQEEIWSMLQNSQSQNPNYLDNGEIRAQLEAVVKELPPRQQEVFNLNNDGFSLPEISSKLGIAQNTVKNHLSRAMKVIRANMKPLLVISMQMTFVV